MSHAPTHPQDPGVRPTCEIARPDRALALATGSASAAPADMTDDPQYQAWVESMAKHCRCSNDRPCDGVLAGGMCDDIQDDPCDDDRVSLAYQEDDSDPMGLGGI